MNLIKLSIAAVRILTKTGFLQGSVEFKSRLFSPFSYHIGLNLLPVSQLHRLNYENQKGQYGLELL